ncbi:MAG TPA: dihydrolipoamide acetyltransferase family protein [Vicinamibacterales bacterium]|nr:dihydrolipoamide acetyltransferase family protein [Vicinamibacterales bacterium]
MNVVMPQMGESIAEGTIVRWIKKVGDNVDRDEPLFEISTDKVDAEIPSPSAGVLTEIKVKEGETVPVNSVVAVIGSGSAADAAAAGSAPAAAAPATSELPEAAVGQPPAGGSSVQAGDPGLQAGDHHTPESAEDLRRQKSSPLVRKIAREHNVDIRQINGTGVSGRVTKNDILGYIASSPSPAAGGAAEGKAQRPSAGHIPAFKGGDKVEIVPMSIMRKKIAEHMVISARTSPHVYSVYEVDFHRLSRLREKKKGEYERNGAKLSFTALIAKAVVDAVRAFPVVNASIDGDNIVYKKDINLGIAVALEQGLIVPVIRNADEKNLLGLSRAIDDLAVRARSKKLNPEEVQGGTFTITNPGIFGAVYGLPLINQPQVAILGVGAIEKRAVVVSTPDGDAIAVHPTCHLSLGYDHRLIDGADAGRFLSYLKERLEKFDEAWM